MALNFGPAAFEAIQSLKNNRDWIVFKETLQEQMEKTIHQALEVGPDQRLDATGYARGIRDVLSAIMMNETGVTAGNRYAKPPIKNKELARG